MRTARRVDESASAAGLQAGDAAHGGRRLLSSARLVLDVIASTGSRDMSRGELARRMHPRGHGRTATHEFVALLCGHGLLCADETTVFITDAGREVAAWWPSSSAAEPSRTTTAARPPGR